MWDICINVYIYQLAKWPSYNTAYPSKASNQGKKEPAINAKANRMICQPLP